VIDPLDRARKLAKLEGRRVQAFGRALLRLEILMLIAALIGAVALIFLAVAGFILLSSWLGEARTALMIGLVLLVLAIGLGLIARASLRNAELRKLDREIRAARRDLHSEVTALSALAGLSRLTGRGRGGLIAALVAGLVLGLGGRSGEGGESDDGGRGRR